MPHKLANMSPSLRIKATIGLIVVFGMLSVRGASLQSAAVLSCAGQRDGVVLPVPLECSQFLICLDGMEMKLDCGADMHFDVKTKTCVEAQRSHCIPGQLRLVEKAREPVIPQGVCTGRSLGAFIPSPFDCRDFFVCVGSEPLVRSCPDGMDFSPESQACIAEVLSKCFIEPKVESADADSVPKHEHEVEKEKSQSHLLAPTEVKPEEVNAEELKEEELKEGQKPAAVLSTISDADSVPKHEHEVEKEKSQSHLLTPTEVKPEEVKAEELKEQELKEGQKPAAILSTISSEHICSGHRNGEMFPTAGSCSNYIVCLQQEATEHSCGFRHFDPMRKVCVDIELSSCIEGQASAYLGVIVKHHELENNGIGNQEALGGDKTEKKSETITQDQQSTHAGPSNVSVVNGVQLSGNNKRIPIKQSDLPAGPVSSDAGTKSVVAENLGHLTDKKPVELVNLDEADHTEKKKESEDISKDKSDHQEVVLAVIDENESDTCSGAQSGTLLPRVGSCKQFITCVDGVAFVGQCPHGLHFNAKAKFCDWPQLAGCTM